MEEYDSLLEQVTPFKYCEGGVMGGGSGGIHRLISAAIQQQQQQLMRSQIGGTDLHPALVMT